MRQSVLRTRLLRISSINQRCFHSHENSTTSRPFDVVEDSILSAAYRHVPQHGFSKQALNLGAHDAGYPDISPSVLTDGTFRLIYYHLVHQRLRLAQMSANFLDNKSTISNGDVSSRVAAVTWARLLANKDVISKWQEALAVMAQPSYVLASLKELALLSDEIWYISGDKSVDSTWYTKRASLSMIYSTSELYMTNDKSPDFIDTHSFLTRRINEAKQTGGLVRSVGTWANFTMNAGINVLRSKGMRV